MCPERPNNRYAGADQFLPQVQTRPALARMWSSGSISSIPAVNHSEARAAIPRHSCSVHFKSIRKHRKSSFQGQYEFDASCRYIQFFAAEFPIPLYDR
jgi:hypothetical protein